MAHIVTLRILVDEADVSGIYDGLNEMLRNAQVNESCYEDCLNIVDWKFEAVEAVDVSLDDMIANGVYAEGDAFCELGRKSEVAQAQSFIMEKADQSAMF